MTRDMTTGSPVKRILSFCFPLLVGNLFQQFYNLADSIIVGRFVGADAFAAVGSTGSLNFLVIGFALGICSGFAIPVAQAFGAGDHKTMRRYAAQSVYLAAGFSAAITLLMLFLTRPVLILLKTPAEILDDAYSYIFIVFMGVTVTIFYNLLAGMLRALGDSRTPLLFLILACAVNIGLDLLFVIDFGMGVSGAAFATVIAQGVSALACLVYIARRVPALRLKKEDFAASRDGMKRLLSAGVPMGLQFSITAVGSILMQAAVNSLGSAVVTVVAAGGKIQLIVTAPLESLGITMATYCGQNLGAGKIDRIRTGVSRVLAVGLVWCAAAVCITWFASSDIALMFLDPAETGEQIFSDIHRFLFLNGLFYPSLLLIFVLRNSLQGLGFSNSAMFAGLFEMIARSIVAFGLIPVFGFTAACFANPAAWIAADILLIPLYLVKIRLLTGRLRGEGLAKRCGASAV